jgi:hypothetical protein
MPDSQAIEAEPGLQLLFSMLHFAAAVVLAGILINFASLQGYIPDRRELGPREMPIRFDPVAFDAAGFAPLKLAGAWELSAADPRFGGASALAVTGDGLLALSDSGVLFRFPKPGAGRATVRIDELPDGPNDRRFKRNRDSESLLRDWRGRGWWVGFENRNRVWLYDRDFTRMLDRFKIGRGWPRDSGFEAMAAARSSDGAERKLLIPEAGRKLLAAEIGGNRAQWVPLPVRPISDAASMPDGSLLLLRRSLHMTGLQNDLVQVRRTAGGYAVERRIPLGVSRLDNLEGLAIERAANGALRLWMISDDGKAWPQRTVLVALDWLPARMARGGR